MTELRLGERQSLPTFLVRNDKRTWPRQPGWIAEEKMTTRCLETLEPTLEFWSSSRRDLLQMLKIVSGNISRMHEFCYIRSMMRLSSPYPTGRKYTLEASEIRVVPDSGWDRGAQKNIDRFPHNKRLEQGQPTTHGHFLVETGAAPTWPILNGFLLRFQFPFQAHSVGRATY